MHIRLSSLLTFSLLLMAGCSAQPDAPALSEYVSQQHRAIKSLSDEDVDDLLNGRGWGFAKAAELNGVPGPLHVLETREHMQLSEQQLSRIEEIRSDMKTKAASLGSTYVAVQKDINDLFAGKERDAATLRKLLDRSAEVRGDLAFTHLNAHLQTLDILTPGQVETYNRLRGYDAADPCSNIPEGHDPEMWRKHNNCGE